MSYRYRYPYRPRYRPSSSRRQDAKPGPFARFAALPWETILTVSLALAAAVLALAQFAPPSWFADLPRGQEAHARSFGMVVAAGLTVAGGLLAWGSYSRARRRRLWAIAKRDMAALQALTWQEFERLVAEAFRAQGYSADILGGGGADGGVDVIARKGSEVILVQCKHWQARIGAPTVREIFGLMHAQKAQRCVVASFAGATRQARAFAASNPAIELLDGHGILRLLHRAA